MKFKNSHNTLNQAARSLTGAMFSAFYFLLAILIFDGLIGTFLCIPFALISPLVPSAGNLLKANHRSHLDAFFFLANVQGDRALTRERLFKIPFLKTYMRMSHQIFILQECLDGFFKNLNDAQNKQIWPNKELRFVFCKAYKTAMDVSSGITGCVAA